MVRARWATDWIGSPGGESSKQDKIRNCLSVKAVDKSDDVDEVDEVEPGTGGWDTGGTSLLTSIDLSTDSGRARNRCSAADSADSGSDGRSDSFKGRTLERMGIIKTQVSLLVTYIYLVFITSAT